MMSSQGVPEGYKQTKVGVIPQEWEVIIFNDLKDKKVSHSITGGPFGSNLKSEHYTKSGVRIIQLQNIGDGSFINKDFIYTNEAKATELKSCLIYPNDIILAKMAEPVARACIIPNFEDKFLMGSDGIRLHIDKSKYDNKFILESINYQNFRKIAIAQSTGSTRQRIGLSDLKTIPIIIPPLKEQQKIAEILTTWDDSISCHEKLIKAKEQLKKGLMQKLLSGEVRFSGFDEGWKEVRLEKILKIGSGKDYKHLNKGDIPVYGTGGYMLNVDEYLYDGDSVCIGRKGTIDKPMFLNGKFWTVDTLFYTHSYKNTMPKFLYFAFLQINWKKYNEASGVPSLSKSTIETIKIKLPSLKEQQKIAQVLSTVDKEIELLKKELESLKEQKKGLMQRLLTGEVRVKINIGEVDND